MIALQLLGLQAVVFVEIERHHAREIEPFLLVHADQFAIHAHGSGAGGQAEHGTLAECVPFANDVGDRVRHMASQIAVGIEDVTGDFGPGHSARRRNGA